MLEPGQWVATLCPFRITEKARVWSKTTGLKAVPAGAIGFINATSPTNSYGRYLVTFPGKPPISLRIRPADLTEVEVREIHVANELITGGVGRAKQGRARLALLPARLPRRRSTDKRFARSVNITNAEIDYVSALAELRKAPTRGTNRAREPRPGNAWTK